MNTIKHGMTGYHIPAYMEEILTHNYCPCFVRMTMVRDGESYKLSYRPGNMKKLDVSSLDTYRKLLLLRSLIWISETAQNYLIGPECYLIEPELIFAQKNSTLAGKIRLLFYPDAKKMKLTGKLMLFAERIRDNNKRSERELFDQLREVIETGDVNRVKMFLDKHILRIENRTGIKAG